MANMPDAAPWAVNARRLKIQTGDQWAKGISGLQVISEDVGMTLDKADMASLGRAKKVSITKDDTILLDGGGAKDGIEERCEQIRQAVSTSTSDYDRCGFASLLNFKPPGNPGVSHNILVPVRIGVRCGMCCGHILQALKWLKEKVQWLRLVLYLWQGEAPGAVGEAERRRGRP